MSLALISASSNPLVSFTLRMISARAASSETKVQSLAVVCNGETASLVGWSRRPSRERGLGSISTPLLPSPSSFAQPPPPSPLLLPPSSFLLPERLVGLMVVGCLFNVPATCECISGTDLLQQFYVLPH